MPVDEPAIGDAPVEVSLFSRLYEIELTGGNMDFDALAPVENQVILFDAVGEDHATGLHVRENFELLAALERTD